MTIITRLDKIIFFQKSLLTWFDINQRPFPWRKKDLSNYQIVISEVLLQRTKAETVSKFFKQFLDQYPDWENIAFDKSTNLENTLKPLGLYRQRAKRLQELAKYMVENKGVLPANRKNLNKVPMMGQYIANAIELQIFKRNMPLLDVNMARVLERFFEPRKMADIRYDPDLNRLAFEVINIDKSKALNWAILDFAAIICRARNPLCEVCLLNSKCNYFIHRV